MKTTITVLTACLAATSATASEIDRYTIETAGNRPVLLAMATPPQSAPKTVPKTDSQSRDYGRVVAVAGIRGLNEETLRAARYDGEQMKQLNSLAVTADESRQFAADGALSSRKVAYLPKPTRTRTSPQGVPQP
mgnify:CR=1 FL=1